VIREKLRALLRRSTGFWATRSVLIGLGVGLIDQTIGGTLAIGLHVPTRFAAMTAMVVSATLTFFLNRRFAFKAHAVAYPALKYILVCAGEIIVSGQLVMMFRDMAHLAYPLAKICSDLIVFTVPHLLLLRYVVFSRQVV
jgi:putative flippase GtrA